SGRLPLRRERGRRHHPVHRLHRRRLRRRELAALGSRMQRLLLTTRGRAREPFAPACGPSLQMTPHRHVVLSALWLAACSDGALALQTAADTGPSPDAFHAPDGGGDAAGSADAGVLACGLTQVRPWAVHASGAFVYDAATDTTVRDLGGPITAVDVAAPSF